MGLVQRRKELSRRTVREALYVLTTLEGMHPKDDDVAADVEALKQHWRIRYGTMEWLRKAENAEVSALKEQAREMLAA